MAPISLLSSFVHTLEERFSNDASTMPTSEWVCANTHLKKKPFSFKKYEFQIQIINDSHPNLCCIKPSQVGLSEIQIRKYLAFLRRTTAITGIFTMPTDVMRDRMSQTRVRPIIESEPVFNPATQEKPVRQKGLYQIDQSFAYFTGNTEGDATSISADILYHDELDLSDQEMIALFQSRLQGSDYKITQAFSTPSYTGYGIDALYTNSDQLEYLYRCPSCNHHQIPTFEPRFVCLPGLNKDVEDLSMLSQDQISAIDHENTHWRCEKCSSPLDLTDPSLREWVPRHPGRPTRGYRVRPTSVSTITVPYILQQLSNYARLDNLKGFRNTVLGQPDDTGGARLTEAEIRAAMQSPAVPDVSPDVPCLLGIDVGITCHVILATFGTTIFFRQIPSNQLLQFVTDLLTKYTIVAGCIDRYPDTSLSEQIRDLSSNVIMPVHYATTPNAPTIKEVFDIEESPSHWNCHRTKGIDDAVSLIRRSRLSLNGYGNLAAIIVTHLRDMVRVENPDTPATWNKLRGEDHFFHALTYLSIARKSVETDFLNHDAEKRTQCFILPTASSKQPSLSPSSLNKITHGSFPQI
jgi:hypothetical protein